MSASRHTGQLSQTFGRKTLARDNTDLELKKLLAANDQAICLDEWLGFAFHNERALYPAFAIQRALHKSCLGPDYWRALGRKREERFGRMTWLDIANAYDAKILADAKREGLAEPAVLMKTVDAERAKKERPPAAADDTPKTAARRNRAARHPTAYATIVSPNSGTRTRITTSSTRNRWARSRSAGDEAAPQPPRAPARPPRNRRRRDAPVDATAVLDDTPMSPKAVVVGHPRTARRSKTFPQGTTKLVRVAPAPAPAPEPEPVAAAVAVAPPVVAEEAPPPRKERELTRAERQRTSVKRTSKDHGLLTAMFIQRDRPGETAGSSEWSSSPEKHETSDRWQDAEANEDFKTPPKRKRRKPKSVLLKRRRDEIWRNTEPAADIGNRATKWQLPGASYH